MAEREGLVDTAVKIAATGRIQRQPVKALEGIVVCLVLCINAVNCSLSEDRCSTGIWKALRQTRHLASTDASHAEAGTEDEPNTTWNINRVSRLRIANRSTSTTFLSDILTPEIFSVTPPRSSNSTTFY